MTMEQDHRIDELLELIWMLQEEGKLSVGELERQSRQPKLGDLLKRMEKLGYVSREDKELALTRDGVQQARQITRRHRLAECLLRNVLELEDEQVEMTACAFEHILDAAVTDAVCTFLGHPPTCPHGKPIPPGPCCLKRSERLQPIVTRLMDMEPGKSGKIVLITPKHRLRYDKLSTFGLIPGNVVKLVQRYPSCVVRIGETELALDADTVSDIYVRPI